MDRWGDIGVGMSYWGTAENYRAPWQYWSHGEYKPWYSYPLPYETNDIKVTKIPMPNPKRLNICPRCNGNHGGVGQLANTNDFVCLYCGYQVAEYFNAKLNRHIAWVESRERRYGMPVLLSNAELVARKSRQLWLENNREHERERKRRYNREHSEEINAKRREQYATDLSIREKSSVRCLDYRTKTNYYKNNKERIKEYTRKWKRNKKQQKELAELAC